MPFQRSQLAAVIVMFVGLSLCSTVDAADPRIVTALDLFDIPASRQTRLGLYLTAQEAAGAVAAYPDILLLDVRPEVDVERSGLAEAVNRSVPYLVPEAGPPGGGLRQNEQFVTQIASAAGGLQRGRERTFILLCASGVHSALASDLLADAGFSNVYTVVDGYDGEPVAAGTGGPRPQLLGWRALALPWRAQPREDQRWSGRRVP